MPLAQEKVLSLIKSYLDKLEKKPDSLLAEQDLKYWKYYHETYYGALPNNNLFTNGLTPKETSSSNKGEISIRWLNRSVKPTVAQKTSSPYTTEQLKQVTLKHQLPKKQLEKKKPSTPYIVW